jgi:hypothetical protein
MTKEFSQEDFRQIPIVALFSSVEPTEERENHLSGSCSSCRTFAQAALPASSLDCSQISSATADGNVGLRVNAKSADGIRLEKYLLLGGRFERNGLD